MLGIKRDVSGFTPLMKQILSDQNYTDIYVMAGFRKQYTNILRVHLI
jgi:hypothetical protein